MKFLFKTFNRVSFDLNFRGMVASMADGVAFIFNNVFPLGEVQGWALKVVSARNISLLNLSPLSIFFIKIENGFDLSHNALFNNQIREILMGLSMDFRIIGGFLFILWVVFVEGNSSITQQTYKRFCLALIIYSIGWSINCVLFKRLTNIEGGPTPLLNYIDNLSQTTDFNYMSKLSFFILFFIPFIFFYIFFYFRCL